MWQYFGLPCRHKWSKLLHP
ncbi:hypothetical protein CBW58_10695 [Yersinia frederiksenii]|nr:hypothetical protein CBW58_10695 [Yersinia frederiksenii]OWF67894.1 hypothetical protein B4901_16410 [Yersinia frederiksenii]